MSKMPAKKKSCFQITSVTQAQVAASSITDDTESLDDPDESRTEDVSSEIFDVSRADFEPEVCDISSSEETLNNVGETEAPHIPQDGQIPTTSGPLNGGLALRSIGVAGVAHVSQHVLGATGPTGQLSTAGVGQQSPPVAAAGVAHAPVSTAQPTSAASSTTTTSTTSCSSRFRVIKLDHGTGEPFRRGRWTCMEFYERDSEGSVITRTVDSIRHAGAPDHSVDRDSGLGATGGSVAPSTLSSQGPEPAGTDSALAPAEPQQSYSGTLQPQGYAPLAPSPATVQPGAPQSLVPPGTNGVSLQHGQKSPSMPSACQALQFAYPAQQQLLPGHQPSLAPPGQQHQAVGLTVSQGPSPSGAAPGQGPTGHTGEPVGTPAPQALLQQVGGGMAPVPSGVQYQPAGLSGGVPITGTTPFPGAPTSLPNHAPSPMGQQHVPHRDSLGAQGLAAGLVLVEESRRKSDAPPQPLTVSGKDLVKPLIPEGLALATPGVSSLFGIPITIDGDEDGASGASVVAIDNKIEQAMDLVKSHLMYAVREEVEVLKEQIKELFERNSVLERENAVLKSLANSEQLSQLSTPPSNPPRATPPQQAEAPSPQPNASSA
ncbi:hypothetical protein AAFF_G00228050 [Aldrovandia affinis]|uniref:TSC22 domain family protein 2 n=1 Tax=Aldrovandia affinis TaxID=143900 RepID=A0AAD7SV59_9TELE|nr:hypothetical protein AAFF_G00228050 [Aldrovandia affinis]